MNDHFSLIREVRNILKAVVAAISTEPPEGEWNQIRAAMFDALRPFDEARKAVREALRKLNQLPGPCPS
jgi:Flp pilus assembly protein TadD